jgi:EmrB/QacA subfamily drug resistance transporter
MSAAAGRKVNPWVVLVVLSLGTFVTLLDLTIVNVAIPRISAELNAPLDQLLLVLNVYSLVYAVLLITSGRLGDIVGPRNLFAGGLALFTVASALSGLAQDTHQLIAARALQGVGAALLAPQGLPLLLATFPRERRGATFAIFGILAGVAVITGPTLGGWLVTNFGWRWIFFVNVPVGVAVVAASLALVPDVRPGRRHRLDLLGVALATAGLGAVVWALTEAQRYDWGVVAGPVTIPMILGAGVLLLAVFAVTQAARQGREPLLPFAVFGDRDFTLMCVVLLAVGFAMLGLFLPLTIYLQSALGLSALDAGLTVAPQPLAMMVSSAVASSLVQRLSPRALLVPGLLLLAAGMGWIDWAARADAGRWVFLPGLVVSGLGMGCIWTPVFSVATRGLRADLAGVASGVLDTIQELGSVIGSAAIGALLQNRLAVSLHDEAVARSGDVPAQFRDRFVAGFTRSANGGYEVGAGQTGTAAGLPPGVPPGVAHQLAETAHAVFGGAFVAAMRPTLLLPIAALVVVAVACLALLRGGPAAAAGQDAEIRTTEAAEAA